MTIEIRGKIESQGKVGPGYSTDGNLVNSRMTKDLALVTQDLHGRFYESTCRGNTFIASTGAAGVAPGTALSTTPPFTLYNPSGSETHLVIISSSIGYISGTLGSGSIYYAVNNNSSQAAPSGGTVLIPICSLIGNNYAPKGKVFQGATLATTPTLLKDLAIMGSTSTTPPIKDLIDGTIIITPGTSISLQAVASAGIGLLFTFSMIWEEVKI